MSTNRKVVAVGVGIAAILAISVGVKLGGRSESSSLTGRIPANVDPSSPAGQRIDSTAGKPAAVSAVSGSGSDGVTSAGVMSVGTGGQGGSGAQSTVPVLPPKKKDGCVQMSFKLKSGVKANEASKMPAHVLKVDPFAINPKSICVRVNGTPVKFEYTAKNPDEIRIGKLPAIKNDTTVTVRYCLGKSKCSESCVIPRDEFMEALSGDSGDDQDSEDLVGWDSDSKDGEKIKGELAVFKDDLNGKTNSFDGWLSSDQQDAASCGSVMAAKRE